MPHLLQPTHYDEYIAFRRAMLVAEPWSFLSSPDDDALETQDALAERLNDRNVIFVELVDGQIVSSVGLFQHTRPKIAHIAMIWGVYTSPSVRQRGIARAVLAACIDHAHTWPGVARINLSASNRSVAANHLYQSLGFTQWGIEPDAIRIDGESADEYHYSLALGQV